MERSTVFTKTAKGITQVNQRSASLSKDLMKVLKLIDGKSNFGQIMEKAELDKNQLEKALNTLTKDGFARIFQTNGRLNSLQYTDYMITDRCGERLLRGNNRLIRILVRIGWIARRRCTT